MINRVTIYIFFYCLMITPLFAAAPDRAACLTEDTTYLPLIPYLEILPRSGEETTIEQAAEMFASGKGVSVENRFLTADEGPVFWLRFKLANCYSEQVEWLLESNYFRGSSHLRFYYSAPGGAVVKEDFSGNLKRDRKSGTPVFSFYAGTGEVREFFLRLEIKNRFFPNFYIYEMKFFNNNSLSSSLFFGFFAGILFIMAFYNLFLYFSFKEKSFLLFIFFTLSLLVLNANNLRFLSVFFPVLEYNDEKLTFFLKPLCGASFILFSLSFLQMKKFLVFVYRVLLLILFLLPLLVLGALRIPACHLFINILLGVGGLLTIIAAPVIGKRGGMAAKFFLPAAAGLILLGIIAMVHPYILPLNRIVLKLPDLTSCGIILMICIFSFGLSSKINGLQKEKIREKEKAITALKKAEKLKDEFLANTSHELRTPLHGIIGLSEFLLHADLPEKERQSRLQLIAASGKRLFYMVNDILDFSRLKNHDIHLHKKAVSLQAVAGQVMEYAEILKGEKELFIENIIPENLPYLYADEDRLVQIIYNLIGNAIKFTGKGKVTLSAYSLNDEVVVEITDSGIGIPSPAIKDIFLPFYQYTAGNRKAYKGTGLGLSITKQLLECMDGKIGVTSLPGQGSCFFVTLPIAKPQSLTLPSTTGDLFVSKDLSPLLSPASHADNHPITAQVLAVDDDPINLRVVADQLRDNFYTVHTCGRGEQALQILEENIHIDIVFLDVMMPDMSGYEVCRKIREKFSLYEKPVILATAKNRIEDLVAGFASGANDYITKPFERSELLARVQTLVHLRQTSRENHVLESTSRLKSQLLHMAAHGLKNPLSIIQGYLELLKKALSENKHLDEYFDPISRAQEKMHTLITEFLENALIEEGKLILEREPIYLNKTLPLFIHDLLPQAKKKKQDLIFRIDTDEDLWFDGDMKYFHEIVDNLVNNAIKYSEWGKKIIIILGKEKGASRSIASITVKDQGPGMTDEDKKRLFIPFQKLTAKPTGGELSTGLGLAITKKLVELHKGGIEVDSTLNKGSSFILRFPAYTLSELGSH